jgi:acyl transferase domain-containing protein
VSPKNGIDTDSSQRVLLALREARLRLEAVERFAAEPIAVVGVGCRFPGCADGPDAYWRLLLDGEDAVGRIPADRYDVEALYDPTPGVPGTMYMREGAFLDGIDRFDASFFGISPREAVSLDPQQRLLLEVAWEALEHSGQAPDQLRGSRTGVFVGIGRNDYAHRLLRNPVDSLTAWHATGNGLCFGPGRLAHVLDLRGPNMAVDTACSSSLLAVHLACQSLRLRECDMALAGGCHVHLSPQVAMMLSMSRALAPDGRCKTFDASADGFGQGEGCGIVVLRRLSDALAHRDDILALIRGSAVNHDGHSSGLTVPNQSAQEQVIRDALVNARVEPAEIHYVEAHGTGTALGDPIEIEALAATLCRDQSRDAALSVGSVKTNIGHLEAAAGIAGLIKTVLALRHEVIPPHLHLQQPNPRIPWDDLPIWIPTHPTPWRRGPVPRLAGVSSFGMSGTNAHVVLQEAPPPQPEPATWERPLHAVTLSARSAVALREQARRLADHLSEHGQADLGDIAFTANNGRTHFPVRSGFVAGSTAELAGSLAEVAAGRVEPAVTAEDDVEAPRVAFLFSGQGSQYPRMGRQLYEAEPVFRQTIDRCDEILRPALQASLCEVLFAGDGDRRLDQTLYTQPALFAVEMGLAELWRSWGVVPQAVLGHSVGEYAAACIAGVFGLEQGLRLIAERARLMQSLPAGGMAAVFASEDRVGQAIAAHRNEVAVAAVNGSASVVIAGREGPLQAVIAALEADGVDVRMLNTSHAFHSPMMEPILAPFAEAAGLVRYALARVPVVSNVTGNLYDRPPTVGYWVSHVRQPVRFADGVDTLARRGYRIFVEIGPGGTLLGMAGRHLGQASPVLLPSLLANRDDWRTLLQSLVRLYELGVPVDWAGFDQHYPRRRTALPTYPFERQRFWCEEVPDPAPALKAHREIPAYRLNWLEQGKAAVRQEKGGQWLVLADRMGLGERFGRTVEDRGGTCFHVDPACLTDFSRLLDALPHPSRLAGIVFFHDGGDREVRDLTGEEMLAAQMRSCGSLLHLVRVLALQGVRGTRLWLVTRNATAGDPVASSIWGMGKAVALEHPEFWGGMIDLAGPPAEGDAADLLTAMEVAGFEDHILLRGGRRFVGRVEPVTAPGREFPQLYGNGTCLITGGLGALGLRVAHWLIERGARTLVLMGRHDPSPTTTDAIAGLRRMGADVTAVAADVADEPALARVLATIEASMPPLRGIVHAAGIFGHDQLTDLDADKLRSVLLPKVEGGWLLHRLTRHLKLDFFVCFSSAAALWGSKGQAHYAAANGFLDGLAHHRRSLGLPALSIAWGPWDGAGMASPEARNLLNRIGIKSLKPDDALAALGRIGGSEHPHMALADVDWVTFRKVYEAGRRRPLLDNLVPAEDRAEDQAGAAVRPASVEPAIAGLLAARRSDRLVEHLQKELSGVLGLGDAVLPDARKGFFRLGMDSLMAVEFANRLARTFRVPLSPAVIFDYPTVAELAGHLAKDVLGWEEPAAERWEAPDGHGPPSADAMPETIASKLARLESLVRET